MRYMIQETITRDYYIEANSQEEALEKAFEIDDSWDYDESCHGFTYLINTETQQDRFL